MTIYHSARVDSLTGKMARYGQYLSAETLNLIVMPTEQCNFRCTYCYEDFLVGRMSQNTVDALKLYLDRRAPTLKRVHLEWFGGEPLLAADIVLDVSKHLKTLVEQTPGLVMTSGATTNGSLLTPKLLADLVAVGVTQFQVSVDGPRALHNATRVRRSGRGSFEEVWGALTTLKNSIFDVRVTIRVHVDADKVSMLPEFLQSVRDSFLDDDRFELFVKAIEKLGGKNDDNLPIMPRDQLAQLVDTACRRLGITVNPTSDADSVCYAAQGTSFVVRATGRIAKCTVALSDPRNDVGQLRLDGSLEVYGSKVAPWLRGLTSGDESALACPLVGLPSGRLTLPLSVRVG